MAIVVLLFLQDWKSLLLPVIDVGVSLVGTFAIMSLLGFSLNKLTLFGLVLAIGIVVDATSTASAAPGRSTPKPTPHSA